MLNMTRDECLTSAATVCACYGFASFADMLDLVIMKGFTNCPVPITRHHWAQVEKAFHTAQFLTWAAEEEGERRAYWVASAAKRLPPMSYDRWRGLPQALKALV
jgi:hypothetical protein